MDPVGSVICMVATRTGQSILSIGAQAYCITLWTFAMILDMDNIATVMAVGDRTDLAGMIAHGFHKPELLKEHEQRFMRLAGMTIPRKEVMERALKMASEIERAKVAR